jgi:hypothetical protein
VVAVNQSDAKIDHAAPSGTYKNPSYRLPEFVAFVSEIDREGVLEGLVEPLNVAGRVGREPPLD